MRIYAKCKHCDVEIAHITKAKTRVDLAMQEGDKIKLKCWSCNHQQESVPNDFVARPSKLAQWVAGGIFLFGTVGVVLFFYPVFFEFRGGIIWTLVVGVIVLAPLSAWRAINNQERNRVNSFNRNRLR